MAEEQDSQEKTEEPTQRKIDKSIDDGQFLTSKEMFVFSSVFIGLLTLVFIIMNNIFFFLVAVLLGNTRLCQDHCLLGVHKPGTK